MKSKHFIHQYFLNNQKCLVTDGDNINVTDRDILSIQVYTKNNEYIINLNILR